MKNILIVLKDEKSENTIWRIIENEDLLIRDMRTAYSKTAWENMKDDLTWEVVGEVEGTEIKIYENRRKNKLANYSYETGKRIGEN